MWISHVQRKIWIIVWDMWEHRNEHLHNNGTSIHLYEVNTLDDEIKNEWDTGLDQLPQQYLHLFEGPLNEQIINTVNQKLMRLASVWWARDNEIHVRPMRQRNMTIITIYDRWK